MLEMDYKETVAEITKNIRITCLKVTVKTSLVVGLVFLIGIYTYSFIKPLPFKINSLDGFFYLFFSWFGISWVMYEAWILTQARNIGSLILPILLKDIYGDSRVEGLDIDQIEGRSMSELTEREICFLTHALNNGLLNSKDVMSETDLRVLMQLNTKWQALDIVKTSKYSILKRR